MPFNVPVLDLDITGTNLNNRIVDEPHTLSNRPTRSIATNYGPFFAESIIVKDGATVLARGIDFQIVELHQEATLKYGKEISSVILIINQNVSSNVTVTYQALGGHYTYSDVAIANMYQSVINDTSPVPWDSIFNKPTEFNPTIHRHLLDDVYGFEPVVDYLERIKRAITLGQTSIVLELVNSLLSKFKCKQLPKVLPSNKLLQYDALLFFLSRRKILNDIWVDLVNCTWLKGGSYIVEVDTSGYPINTTLYWEFYKPDLSITLFSTKNGTIKTNGGIQTFTVYVPSEDNIIEDPIYIGIKENPLDEDYKAVTYVINIEEHNSTDVYAPILVNGDNSNTLGTVSTYGYGQDYETYLYFRTTLS
jgi:hypothetical protein